MSSSRSFEPVIQTSHSYSPSPAPNTSLPPEDYVGNSHMLRTATYTAYRTGVRPHFPKRASWVNTTRTTSLSPRSSRQNSRAASPIGTPVLSRNPSPVREFSTTAFRRGKDESVSDKPPKHQMVHLPGLLSEVREFGVFRKVLHTGLYSQLVAMEVPVGGEIGDEVHTVDQILLFTSGRGRAIVAGKEQDVRASDVVVVPAGTQHQFLNTGDAPLELITVYSPAEHHPQSVHRTKEEGDEEEEAGVDEAPAWSRRSKGENEGRGAVKIEGGPYNE